MRPWHSCTVPPWPWAEPSTSDPAPAPQRRACLQRAALVERERHVLEVAARRHVQPRVLQGTRQVVVTWAWAEHPAAKGRSWCALAGSAQVLARQAKANERLAIPLGQRRSQRQVAAARAPRLACSYSFSASSCWSDSSACMMSLLCSLHPGGPARAGAAGGAQSASLLCWRPRKRTGTAADKHARQQAQQQHAPLTQHTTLGSAPRPPTPRPPLGTRLSAAATSGLSGPSCCSMVASPLRISSKLGPTAAAQRGGVGRGG